MAHNLPDAFDELRWYPSESDTRVVRCRLTSARLSLMTLASALQWSGVLVGYTDGVTLAAWPRDFPKSSRIWTTLTNINLTEIELAHPPMAIYED